MPVQEPTIGTGQICLQQLRAYAVIAHVGKSGNAINGQGFQSQAEYHYKEYSGSQEKQEIV